MWMTGPAVILEAFEYIVNVSAPNNKFLIQVQYVGEVMQLHVCVNHLILR